MAEIASGSADARLADDMLTGAAAIAEYLFGDARERRRVYHLARTGQIPVFHLGALVCARKSTLKAAVEEAEAKARAAA